MSTVLPVIQSDRNGRPRVDVDFDKKLTAHAIALKSATIDTLQVNVGKLCNQACKHCHVDASPTRTEIMTRKTAEAVIDAVRRWRIPIVDITGGAPELNPSFRYLVREQAVEVVSSLPYFLEDRTDAQRGHGVFQKSVIALRRLNAAGYGKETSELT